MDYLSPYSQLNLQENMTIPLTGMNEFWLTAFGVISNVQLSTFKLHIFHSNWSGYNPMFLTKINLFDGVPGTVDPKSI